ncbi:MAG: MFS transporter [Bacteroidales bacterium]|nr:MFS transporter [Bacteroidales bacterium]
MLNSSQTEKYSTLLVASVASFLTPFMGSATNIALPTIGAEFSSDAITLSWVATAYLLAVAIFLIPFGRVADIFGRKKIFLYGIILFTIASLLSGLTNNILTLIFYRVLQAIGSAMIFSTSVAIITAVFPPKERGRAMGIAVGAVYLGLSLGPFAGGILTQYFGWRSIFFFVVPLGLIAIYFVLTKLKNEWADSKGEPFDWIGSGLYAIALSFIMLGFPRLPKVAGITYLLIGILFLLVFIWYELRSKYPVLDLHIFQSNITFRYSNLAALINYSATFAVAFLLSFYLQYFKGLDPQSAGFVLVAQPVIMTIFSPWAGRLSDRIDPRIISSAGMSVSALGLGLLAFISTKTSLVHLVLVLMLLGMGFALFSSPNSNSIMSSVDRKHLGIASASLGTMRMIGQMLSMGIAMMLFAFYIGQHKIDSSNLDQLLKSLQTAFIIFAFLCFLGVFASLARGKMQTSKE